MRASDARTPITRPSIVRARFIERLLQTLAAKRPTGMRHSSFYRVRVRDSRKRSRMNKLRCGGNETRPSGSHRFPGRQIAIIEPPYYQRYRSGVDVWPLWRLPRSPRVLVDNICSTARSVYSARVPHCDEMARDFVQADDVCSDRRAPIDSGRRDGESGVKGRRLRLTCASRARSETRNLCIVEMAGCDR